MLQQSRKRRCARARVPARNSVLLFPDVQYGGVLQRFLNSKQDLEQYKDRANWYLPKFSADDAPDWNPGRFVRSRQLAPGLREVRGTAGCVGSVTWDCCNHKT